MANDDPARRELNVGRLSFAAAPVLLASVLALAPHAAAAEPRTSAFDLDAVAATRIGADLPGADMEAPRGVGDINGDGRPDTIASLVPWKPGRAGRLRVTFTPPLDGLLRLSRQAGFDIPLSGNPDHVSYAGAGDVNGDGLADIVVVAGRKAYVVEGAASTSTVRLGALGARGFVIGGLDLGGQELPPAAFGAGDVNGDGLGDVVVGSPGSDPGGRAQAGSAFVVYGEAGSGDVDVNALGARGYRIDGAAQGDSIGASGGPAGDVNGDGRPDLALGGNRSQPEFADDPLWVVTGGGALDLARPGTAAYPVTGAAAPYGPPATGTGDVNGDGIGDLLLAAEGEDQAFLVYGSPGGSAVDLDKPDPGRVVTMTHASFSSSRAALGDPGDTTGDGLADLVVGTAFDGAWFVRGAADLPATLDLKHLGAHGFKLDSATATDGIGDVDGDGLGELLLGGFYGYRCRPTAEIARGSIVLLRGGALPPPLLAHGSYTSGPDVLRGTRRGDVIFGARGDDRLVGGPGDDCLTGGEDDYYEALDEYLAPRPDKDRLYGGPGRDYMRGGTSSDLLVGGRGDDIMYGDFGRDRVYGGPGDDYLIEEYAEYKPGNSDVLSAGSGNDIVYSADGSSDTIDCGRGRDRITADRGDVLRRCERITRRREFDASLDYPYLGR